MQCECDDDLANPYNDTLRGIIMRTLTTIALIAAASFSSLALAAPANPVIQSDTSSVSVTGSRAATYAVPQYEFDDYNGSFALSNGKRLTVSHNSTRFFAQIDKNKRFEIVPTGHKTFAAKDSDFEVRYDEFRDNRVNDVVVVAPRF